MKIAVIHRLDDTYIEKAWKNAELEEIEDLAAKILGKTQEARSIEDDLICILCLAFRCGFKTAIDSNWISIHGRARHFARDMAPFSANESSDPVAYADLAKGLPANTEARLFRRSDEPLPPVLWRKPIAVQA